MKKLLFLFALASFFLVPFNHLAKADSLATNAYNNLGIATTGNLQEIQNQIDNIQAQVSALQKQVGVKLGSIVINPPVLTSSTVAGLIPNPLVIGGVESSTITGDTSNSQIQLFNTTYYIPADYATNGCFGSSTTTDLGACANLAYLMAASVGSSTHIIVPSLPAYTPFGTSINFGTNLEYAELECAAGQILKYTGSSYAINYNEGQGTTASRHIPHIGGVNCVFAGSGGTVTATSTANGTGILIGGSNGEAALQLNNMGAINIGIGFNLTAGTYMFSAYSPYVQGDAEDLLVNSPSNSGESQKFYGLTAADPGNSSSSDCVVLQANAEASVEFFGGSLDDCQLHVKSGNLNVALYGVHLENPASNYPTYDKILVDSDTATTLLMSGGTVMEDRTSTVAGGPIPEEVNCGAVCKWDTVSAVRNAGTSATTTTVFGANTASTANSIVTFCNVSNIQSAYSNIGPLATGSPTTNNGCITSFHNGYVTGYNQIQNGMIMYDGNHGVGETIIGNIGNTDQAVSFDFSGNKLQIQGSSTIQDDGSWGCRITSSGVSTTLPGLEAGAQGQCTFAATASVVTTTTLPSLNLVQGRFAFVKNRGTANLFIAASGTDQFYGMATSTSYLIGPGSQALFQDENGAFWDVLVPSGSICTTYVDRVSGIDYVYASSTALVITQTKPAFCQ